MATYVRFGTLYQAYLNACLLLLAIEAETQTYFPEQGDFARTPFASFGGPHILSLVTEVATRCLKFARRQKFNFHRRPRSERIAGMLSVAHAENKGVQFKQLGDHANSAPQGMLKAMTVEFQKLIIEHNKGRKLNNDQSKVETEESDEPDWFDKDGNSHNLPLGMAFPEGSPMHPAYAAGHATVAGGCVTMLKAFFNTVEDDFTPVPWSNTKLKVAQAHEDGNSLIDADGSDMTLVGELNKLAANVSIARNMAGVHYYSDYYDSLRTGRACCGEHSRRTIRNL